MNNKKIIDNSKISAYLFDLIDCHHSNIPNKKRILGDKLKKFRNFLKVYFNEYLIKESSGIGNLAEIPWLIISNPSITKGASKGYYVVILFDSIERNVVFQLCYSWTPFKSTNKLKIAIQKAMEVSTHTKEEITKNFKDDINYYFDKSIRPLGTGILAKGYCAGNIVGKMISQKNLADTDFYSLIKKLLSYYSYMQNNLLGALKFEDFVIKLDETKDFKNAFISTWHEYKSKVKIRGFNGYKHIAPKKINQKKGNTVISKSKYKEIREAQSKIGGQGEELVKDYENKKLKGTIYKAEILKTDGNGYDILSYEKNGREKMIEVKSTEKNSKTVTFYISSNEINLARALKNYYLYVVTNVGKPEVKIFEFSKPFDIKIQEKQKIFNLVPTNYKVTINLK